MLHAWSEYIVYGYSAYSVYTCAAAVRPAVHIHHYSGIQYTRIHAPLSAPHSHSTCARAYAGMRIRQHHLRSPEHMPLICRSIPLSMLSDAMSTFHALTCSLTAVRGQEGGVSSLCHDLTLSGRARFARSRRWTEVHLPFVDPIAWLLPRCVALVQVQGSC